MRDMTALINSLRSAASRRGGAPTNWRRRLLALCVTAAIGLTGSLVAASPAQAGHVCTSRIQNVWLKNPACAHDRTTRGTALVCLDNNCDNKAYVKLRRGVHYNPNVGQWREYAWATYRGPELYNRYIRLRVLSPGGDLIAASSRDLVVRKYTAGHTLHGVHAQNRYQACLAYKNDGAWRHLVCTHAFYGWDI